MTVVIDDAESVAARIRTAWSDAPPAEGFVLDGAHALHDAVEVAFHWRRDPQAYLVRFPHPGFAGEVFGEDAAGFDVADEMRLWLMEELDTGFVGRARRVRVGDAVLLEEQPVPDTGWFVGDVPLTASPAAVQRATEVAARTGRSVVVVPSGLGDLEPIDDPGRFLDLSGLDGSEGRRAVREGSLVAWLQVGRGGLGDGPVGQAVVVRDGPEAAVLHLEVRTSSAAGPLAAAACRRAVEAGARTLSAAVGTPALAALGFHDVGGRLVARHDGIAAPDAG